MSWFTRFCRNLGLMVHNIRHPSGTSEKRVLRNTKEEQKQGGVTLRRTTIDEVEIKSDDGKRER